MNSIISMNHSEKWQKADYIEDKRDVAQALNTRAAELVRLGYLDPDYARKCFTLADVRKAVKRAESELDTAAFIAAATEDETPDPRFQPDASNDMLAAALDDAGFGGFGPL